MGYNTQEFHAVPRQSNCQPGNDLMEINAPSPVFELENTRGEYVSLSKVLQNGNHVLLVFLRHLG